MFTSSSNAVVLVANLRFLDSYDTLIQLKMNFYQIYFLFILYSAIFLWPVTITNVSSCVFLCDLKKILLLFLVFGWHNRTSVTVNPCFDAPWGCRNLCHFQLYCPATRFILNCTHKQRWSYLFNQLRPCVTFDAESRWYIVPFKVYLCVFKIIFLLQ